MGVLCDSTGAVKEVPTFLLRTSACSVSHDYAGKRVGLNLVICFCGGRVSNWQERHRRSMFPKPARFGAEGESQAQAG